MITCTFEDDITVSLRHVVVDALVLKDNKVLLVKRAKTLKEGGKWGLAGGYMERDETIVEAAKREILEETGWTVENLTLLCITDTPNRPKEDRQNVAFIYFCQAHEKVGEPDWESDEQQWFELDKLPPRNHIAFDHADNIDLYQKYLQASFPLPLIG